MKVDFSKLKDVDLKDINLKELKNKKELLILLGIVIFVVAILLIGNSLWTANRAASDELAKLKLDYEKVCAVDSADVLSNEIAVINQEILDKQDALKVLNKIEIRAIVDKMEKDLKVDWNWTFDNNENKTKVTVKSGDKKKGSQDSEIEKYVVNLGSFKGDYNKLKEIMEYVKNMERMVSIDSLALTQSRVDGGTTINMKINFYMEAEKEESKS